MDYYNYTFSLFFRNIMAWKKRVWGKGPSGLLPAHSSKASICNAIALVHMAWVVCISGKASLMLHNISGFWYNTCCHPGAFFKERLFANHCQTALCTHYSSMAQRSKVTHLAEKSHQNIWLKNHELNNMTKQVP